MRTASLRLALAVCTTAVLTSGCTGREAYENAFGIGWPKPKTDRAESMYDVWLGSVAAGAAVGVVVWGLIAYAVVRYRKRTDELPAQIRYNLPIEVLYTVVPFVIIAVLFFYTAVSENEVNKLEPNPDVTVGVVGFQWNWQFIYEDDKVQVTGEPAHPATLVLPVDKRVRFVETSPDVIHSFWVPDFLFKRDVVPGRFNAFELTPTREGTYVGRCAEFCGEKHSRMNFTVKVVSQTEYDAYIAGLKADPAAGLDELSKALEGAIPTARN
ncbi:MAG TPA: cytochrome c oxidase subunit II [Mycobacteriales bacterium]|nr:cytochrome c oxidase subunit II [Mycobacteriales bacterium]